MSSGESTIVQTGTEAKTRRKLPVWFWILVPILAIITMLVVFAFGNPLSLFTADLPPIEDLTLNRIRVNEGGFEVSLVNGGPDPVTISQVLVDDAYWSYQITPSATLPRLGRAEIEIPYPWVKNEPHEIVLVTSTGLTFGGEVQIAVVTPTPGLEEFMAYGLLGIYVGIIPVTLGMLFFPAMKLMRRKWLGAVLALTVGLLVFLLIDTFLEALEVSADLPGVFQGIPLILFAALLTWLLLLAVGSQRKKRGGPGRQVMYIATMIALGIGLHNLGEGLAIGVAFSIGEAALGSFLVIGFMLHNITEGVGIVAPLVPGEKARVSDNEATPPVVPGGKHKEQDNPAPKLRVFIGLALVAGSPAILGAWIGGFAFSPLLAAIFLGIGVGAIWQVIVEVVGLLRAYAEREGNPLVSWVNLAGFLAGIAIMYLTAYLVKF